MQADRLGAGRPGTLHGAASGWPYGRSAGILGTTRDTSCAGAVSSCVGQRAPNRPFAARGYSGHSLEGRPIPDGSLTLSSRQSPHLDYLLDERASRKAAILAAQGLMQRLCAGMSACANRRWHCSRLSCLGVARALDRLGTGPRSSLLQSRRRWSPAPSGSALRGGLVPRAVQA
jgi:hypothetical protein